jgi:hypothetical protein
MQANDNGLEIEVPKDERYREWIEKDLKKVDVWLDVKIDHNPLTNSSEPTTNTTNMEVIKYIF